MYTISSLRLKRIKQFKNNFAIMAKFSFDTDTAKEQKLSATFSVESKILK